MKHKSEIKWSAGPEDHDSPAAGAYLSLLYDGATTARYVKRLRQAPRSTFKAKDIFRASGWSTIERRSSRANHCPRSCSCGLQTTKRSSLPMAIIECARSTRLTRIH